MLASIHPPHPRLAPALMHIMVLELDGCETHVPPAWSPMLVLYLRGGGALVEADGARAALPRFFLSGAASSARHGVYAPGTVALTVMLRPGVVRAALGVHASEIANANLAMGALTGEERVRAFLAELDALPALDAQIDCFQRFLLDTFRPAATHPIAQSFVAARRRLFQPLVELALQFGIAERTLERRMREDFGLPVRDLRRIMRFGLALRELGERETEWGDLTRLAQEAGYYDQAHMHREFVEFSGLGPLQLIRKIGSDDPAYWVYRIGNKTFDDLFLPGA